MFEDALMESGGKIKTKSKYWMIGTFIFNAAILATMILIPLLYPEASPKTAMTAMLTAPTPPPPPPSPPAAHEDPSPAQAGWGDHRGPPARIDSPRDTTGVRGGCLPAA